jgi:uncharacterized protein (DUF433 family)
MGKEYIEQREGGYFIKRSRVSLDSVVYAFLIGESPEGIAESFPALGLEQIFGALAFYMANREMVDRYLSEGRVEFELLRERARQDDPALWTKLTEARNWPTRLVHETAIPSGCRFQSPRSCPPLR